MAVVPPVGRVLDNAVEGGYRVERMSPSGIALAIDWAAREGWNPGLNDAQCFYAIDPDGFLQGLLDGKTIATVSAPIYDGIFAFVGLYIVEPEYRGKGYGMALTRAMLEHIGATVVARRVFADHHAFSESEARDLLDTARRTSADLVTTEKDLARLSGVIGAGANLRMRSTTLKIETVIEEGLAILNAKIREAIRN